jgi:acyl-CoA reductase-like NAD-dependent aldehyde dehydrogenase
MRPSKPCNNGADGQHAEALWPDTVVSKVREALQVARQAQPAWAAQPLPQRLSVIRRLRHRIAQQPERLAQHVPPMAQRALADTLVAEVLPLLEACRYLEREAPRILAPQRLRRRGRPLWLHGVELELRRESLGVVLIMAPANYPLLLPGVQMLQALVAGNAMLLKPGAGGGAAAVALVQHLEDAGLDRRLVQVLSETPAAAQTAIATGVDKVLLTGSATTGAAVLTMLAPHLTPAVLELSGCDAVFVRADADLELVIRALTFSLRLNGGATCIAPRRVFVARPLAAALESGLVCAVQAMAPCTVAPAVTTLVRELVADACAQGARHLTGDFLPDHAMTPVLVADATPAMRLLQADVFAPVLALVPVQDDDDALAAAAPCPYALGATVFGQDQAARALAQRVRAGVVLVNDIIVPTADPRLPFGGRGQSGFGVTRGAAGLLELTCLKVVAIRHGRWRPHYAPPLAQDEALFRAYIAAAHSASFWERLVAGLRCLRVLGQRLWR